MASSKKNKTSHAREETSEEPRQLSGGLIPRIFIGLLLAALGAVLLTLAFPPYNLWPFVFCGLVPILIAVHRVMPRRFAGLAMALGVGGFFWAYYEGMFIGTNAEFLKYLPYVFAFIFLLIGACQRVFHAHTRYWWFIIEGVFVWVGFEMIRGLLPFLGTGAFLANPLYEQFWLIQPVSIFGIYGMSFLVVFINYVLTLQAIALIDNKYNLDSNIVPVSRSAARRWIYGCMVIFLFWAGFSMSLLDIPKAKLRVAAIQPGHYVHELDINGETQKVFRDKIEFQEDLDQLIELTRTAGKKGARLIVWNEASLPFDPQDRGADLLRDLVKEIDAFLIIGYHAENNGGLDEVTILSPDGVFLGSSHQTVIGNIGTATANDLDFTGSIRDITRQESRIVAVSSQEWPDIMSKRFPHIVFRAVENRISIIKSDAHYASAIVDPFGRILQQSVSEDSQRKVLVADVPALVDNTTAMEWGDWLGWVCLAGMVIFIFLEIVTLLTVSRKT